MGMENCEKDILTDKEIINILKYRKLLLDMIQKKMEHAYTVIESLDETIKRLCPKAVRYDLDKVDGGNAAGGLYQILVKRDSEQKRQLNEQEKVISSLIREEEKINRVFQCLVMLPADDYEVLDKLYIKNYTWDYYASQNNISISTLGRKKMHALNALRMLYRSLDSQLLC